jgi:membrane protein DedA with SNARE-associated domain
MNSLLSDASNILATHAAWAGLVLGLVTFCEAILVVGALLPGTAIVCLAGGLVAIGVLDGPSALTGALVGAVLGDALAFLVGRRLGPGALRTAWLAKHRRPMTRTRVLIRRHGVLVLLVGRFAGPLRAFVPLVAGMSRMGLMKFHLANAGAALTWVLISFLPGYIAARGASIADGGLRRIIILAAAALLLLAALVLLRLAVRRRATVGTAALLERPFSYGL